MVVSIGAVASPSQGVSYYEHDGYYAQGDMEHRLTSAWAGKGAAGLGLKGHVDPETFRAVLAGEIPDGSGRRLGRTGKNGQLVHRPGRDLTFSAPKSVSLAGLVGGDARVVEAHARLVSRGYTNAEKALSGNYATADVVVFHRPYKRISVEKGDERRVTGVDQKNREVLLDGGESGAPVRWRPGEIAGRRGGSEVYRAEGIELRAGDRIRWTRNHKGLGLVNSRTAEVVEVRDGRVTFRLEDGKNLELGRGDPQLRHLDHAWASTVHAFQGRTVDNVIAAMEATHPHLTTHKTMYEFDRFRHPCAAERSDTLT